MAVMFSLPGGKACQVREGRMEGAILDRDELQIALIHLADRYEALLGHVEDVAQVTEAATGLHFGRVAATGRLIRCES